MCVCVLRFVGTRRLRVTGVCWGGTRAPCVDVRVHTVQAVRKPLRWLGSNSAAPKMDSTNPQTRAAARDRTGSVSPARGAKMWRSTNRGSIMLPTVAMNTRLLRAGTVRQVHQVCGGQGGE